MERSKERITKADLRKLLRLSEQDILSFFERCPQYSKQYKNKQVLVALCQGAALHYIDRKNGVKDFDVWFFYPQKHLTLPYRRTGSVDYGKSKFGKRKSVARYEGRSIDVLMRSDANFNEGSPESCLRSYLSNAKTKTAKLLGQKAVIGLYPASLFGDVLWPEEP